MSKTKHPVTALALGLAGALFLTMPAASETTPKGGSRDHRITYTKFQEGQVYRINTRLLNITVIELGDGDRIRSISGGDTASFEVGDLAKPNAFTVKPLIAGGKTNFVVETSQRFYFLEMRESSRTAPFYSVKFTTPATGRRKATPQPAAASPMSYAVSQSTKGARFKPRRVWDDGRKTYFQFRPGAPIPSIFRANAKGQEFTVNTSAKGTTVTVSTRSARWVLRIGDAYVCVTGQGG